MLELGAQRKAKLHLSDYDWEKDLRHRALFSDLRQDEFEVIEEIFYSPLKISAKKLGRSFEIEADRFAEILDKLERGALFERQGDTLLVDKETRKRYEHQMERFQPDFKPDLQFMQEILRKVPVHILPSWYTISRTSDNIFLSIVNKYLLTPQIFQRYLLDVSFPEPWMEDLVSTLFASPALKISSAECIQRYHLTREAFDSMALFLEFSFIACLTYEQKDDRWVESLSPFHEWKEYLLLLKRTEAPSLDPEKVEKKEGEDFDYIKTLTRFLEGAGGSAPLRKKALTLRFLNADGDLTEEGQEWLSLSLEKKALALYKHPLNTPLLSSFPMGERGVREAEKTVKRVLHGNWVLFEDFFQGVNPLFRDEHAITLKKGKKEWSYELPVYTAEEKEAVFNAIFSWLKEVGMAATGSFAGQPCFRLTEFGQFFFEE